MKTHIPGVRSRFWGEATTASISFPLSLVPCSIPHTIPLRLHPQRELRARPTKVQRVGAARDCDARDSLIAYRVSLGGGIVYRLAFGLCAVSLWWLALWFNLLGFETQLRSRHPGRAENVFRAWGCVCAMIVLIMILFTFIAAPP